MEKGLKLNLDLNKYDIIELETLEFKGFLLYIKILNILANSLTNLHYRCIVIEIHKSDEEKQ